jgi:hypothetical protein
MASQNPIHTLSKPNPVEAPRAKPLAITACSAGYGRSNGFSDHSGRQGRIMSITPSVAHKKTNRSTPMRRSHRRAMERGAMEGEVLAVADNGEPASEDASCGDLSSPTMVGWPAKGSLGSEIIGRVVVSKAVNKAESKIVELARDRVASRRKFRTRLVHSTTLGPVCARPRRDNRYWRCRRR